MKVSRLCFCGRIVTGECEVCEKAKVRDQDRFREPPSARGYDHCWRKLSEQYRLHNPLCERCKQRGRVEPAVDVHHIKPISTHPELRLVWDNLMALCRPCHREIERENHNGT